MFYFMLGILQRDGVVIFLSYLMQSMEGRLYLTKRLFMFLTMMLVPVKIKLCGRAALGMMGKGKTVGLNAYRFGAREREVGRGLIN